MRWWLPLRLLVVVAVAVLPDTSAFPPSKFPLRPNAPPVSFFDSQPKPSMFVFGHAICCSLSGCEQLVCRPPATVRATATGHRKALSMTDLSSAGKTLVVGATGKVRALTCFRARCMRCRPRDGKGVQVGMLVVQQLCCWNVSVVALARNLESEEAQQLAAMPSVQVVQGDVMCAHSHSPPRNTCDPVTPKSRGR